MLRVPVIGGKQNWAQRQPLQAVQEDRLVLFLIWRWVKKNPSRDRSFVSFFSFANRVFRHPFTTAFC